MTVSKNAFFCTVTKYAMAAKMLQKNAYLTIDSMSNVLSIGQLTP